MKKLGENRWLSIVVIAIVYAIAIFVGVLVYNGLSFAFWWKLLIADITATAVVFLFSVLFKNAFLFIKTL